jgi:hypothetical protein
VSVDRRGKEGERPRGKSMGMKENNGEFLSSLLFISYSKLSDVHSAMHTNNI